MEFLEWLGWRWLRRALPLLVGLVMLAVLSHDSARTWLMAKYQHRAERRIERIVRRMPSLFPSPAPSSGTGR